MDAGVKIILVAAMAKDTRVIGSEGELPWKLSDDLKQLRKLTMGKTVLVGRKTQDSIISRLGHALPDRRTIVLTRDKNYHCQGCETAMSWEEVMRLSKNENELFVLGGAQIYKLAMPFANTIYLTLVDTNRDGDAKFPELKETDWNWEKMSGHAKDEKNEFDFSTWILTRK